MSQPKIGLITFGDNRHHEWEHVFKQITEPRHREAAAYFEQLRIIGLRWLSVRGGTTQIDSQVDALSTEGVEGLVAHTPCWTSPNLVVRGIQRLNLPTVLIGNKHPGTHSTVGLLGAGGTLSQIGYPHMRLREDFNEGLAQKVLPFFRAATVKARLHGKMFGLFGCLPIGIDTGTFDPMQWKKLFGVDTEHIDQLEIIRRAELVPETNTEKMMTWLTHSVGKVAYNDDKFTPEKLAFQVRCYLATMEIIGEMELDFVAIKCMPDLTTHFVTQCISAALLPSPYDANGRRDPIMMACEADGDAALTMEVLKEITGELPVLFMDVSYIDDEHSTFYFPNCGAFCSWYAARSDNPQENMKHIELRPANRPGGGAITYFNTAPGPMTLARLYREDGRYLMGIIRGETVNISPEERDAFVQARGSHQLPTAFLKLDVDTERLISGFGSNHIMGVAGDCVKDLLQFCELMDIEPAFFD